MSRSFLMYPKTFFECKEQRCKTFFFSIYFSTTYPNENQYHTYITLRLTNISLRSKN